MEFSSIACCVIGLAGCALSGSLGDPKAIDGIKRKQKHMQKIIFFIIFLP
jgi:hypothetical protein